MQIITQVGKHKRIRRVRGFRIQIGYPFPEHMPDYNNRVLFSESIPDIWYTTIERPDVTSARLFRSGKLYDTFTRPEQAPNQGNQ